MKRWIPLIITLVFAAWIAGGLRVPADKPGALAVQQFGRLPVMSNGRFQPLDSLARNALLQLREKQTANLEPWKGWNEKPQIISATEWLMTMLMTPDAANEWPVFRIDHPDLKGLLALPGEPDKDKHADGKHYSWTQIAVKLTELRAEAVRASAVKDALRNPFDQAVVRLWSHVLLYMRLQNSVQPHFQDYLTIVRSDPSQGAKFVVDLIDETGAANAKNWGAELNDFLGYAGPGFAALRASQAKQPHDAALLKKFKRDLARFEVMSIEGQPLIVPPQRADASRDNWMKTGDALMEVIRGEPTPFALHAYARMTDAFRAGNTADFNQAVADYHTALKESFPKELKKCANEQFFNFFEPFYKAMILYVVAGLGALAFWVNPGWETLRRTAVRLVLLALAVHTAGLLFRMILEGRPPVTNLYSSAIFIGWGACILGLILEAFWKNSIGITISSVIGFTTLIIAHHLALSGDTMEMMRAVLDTNFWLATHVVVVTLGYASTFVAGFLAMIYIIRGLFTTGLDAGTAKSLAKMVYGICCFATLFSFVGTVLGGIWADQSWGRFWGWDPKENGALIIVLWNALILHARWGGLVRERGLMNLAIVGNIVTSWSWFGVNMLGIGLHSYGFMDAAFYWLMAFVGSQLLLVALGNLPISWWRSFRGSVGGVVESHAVTGLN